MSHAIYVAASSAELDRAERVIATLRALGVTVSHDWCAVMRRHGPDAGLSDAVLLPELRADLTSGVFGAGVVLVLAPDPKIPRRDGMHVELGVAWAHWLRIVVAGDVASLPWLRALMDEHHAEDADAIAAIVQLVREAAA